MAFVFVPFVAYLFLITIYLFFAPLQERISIGLSLLAVAVALLALVARFGEEHTVNMSLSKFGACVEEDEKPLLIALVKMKNKCPAIDLEQIYNQNKSMFQKEILLEKLYE
jgi:multisubunit Na+/H+ antiporter MnhC subunit